MESRFTASTRFYIWTHLRFLTVRTLLPFLGILPTLWLPLFLFFKIFPGEHKDQWLLLVLAVMPGIPAVSAILRYRRSLRFTAVPAPYSLAQNRKLIPLFLAENHFAFAQHPEAPEVFGIFSRNLGKGKQEMREVMLFIADDYRLLLNSHYTHSRRLPPGTDKRREVARMLSGWLHE